MVHVYRLAHYVVQYLSTLQVIIILLLFRLNELHNYPAHVMFLVVFVTLSVCQQDYLHQNERICMMCISEQETIHAI